MQRVARIRLRQLKLVCPAPVPGGATSRIAATRPDGSRARRMVVGRAPSLRRADGLSRYGQQKTEARRDCVSHGYLTATA